MSGLFKYWKKTSNIQKEQNLNTENIENEGDLMSLDSGSVLSEDVMSMESKSLSYDDSYFFENKTAPHRPILKVYPPRVFGKSKRKFNNDWYSKFKWLEYNPEIDAAFCFACRVFLPNPTEKTFTHSGYRDWKNATDKSKGFMKHQQSSNHNSAMKNWADFVTNSEKAGGSGIAKSFVMVSEDQKKWLFAVFIVTRFLCANGLPFRGEDESTIEGDGLYLRSFSELLFPLEPEWEKIHRNLPKNAQYTSPTIQNEVISVLASLVKNKIAKEIQKALIYTIMADGTSDKNHNEVQGLVFRYKKDNGLIAEHCLEMKNVEDRSAKGIFSFIKESLEKNFISKDGIISQSFDGASVMSGSLGGLQKLISNFCGRNVLYVHCFLHKIHLVITFVMKNLEEIEDYFGIVTSLYNFFKKAAVNESYNGSALKRLIDTRWSGHFDSTKNIYKNYPEIIEALHIASQSKRLKSEDRAIAIGLLNQIGHKKNDPIFVFINCLLFNVLQPVNIMVKTLQSSSENAVSAFTVVNEVMEDLKALKNNDDFRSKLNEEVKKRSPDNDNNQRIPNRPNRLRDYFVDQRLPTTTNRKEFEIVEECLDLLLSEFNRRFSTENITLWKAMCALSPTDNHFLDFEFLKPLFIYAESVPVLRDFYNSEKLSVTDLDAECRIFLRLLKNQNWPKDENGKIDLLDVARLMKETHNKAAPILVSLYDLTTTAGFTSTRVECAFSALSRIDTPQRRSMTTDRECNLSYLHFESEVLMQITFDEFYDIWKSKPRRL